MKLIATNILTLTDARFFASYQAEILVVNCDQEEDWPNLLGKLEAIRSWVEGPEWGIRLDFVPSLIFLESVIRAGVQNLFVTSPEVKIIPLLKFWLEIPLDDWLDNQEDLDSFHGVVVRDWNKSHIDFGRLFKEVYYLIERVEDWTQFETRYPPNAIGIVLEGTSEEKTGLKAYENVVEILEKFTS